MTRTILGEAVCRAVLPVVPARVRLAAPGALPCPPGPAWRVCVEPGEDGVQVRLERTVPYPELARDVVTPAYADEVVRALRQAAAALEAARAPQPAPGPDSGEARETQLCAAMCGEPLT